MASEDETANQPQAFTAAFAQDGEFKSAGLRALFAYRDLGIRDGTNGRYLAHVIRTKQAIDKKGDRISGLHYHKLDFQMVYVLKGWVTFYYEGQGDITFRPGDAVLQPPEIRHDIIACSDDMELLEIASPADFETLEANPTASAEAPS